MTNKGGTIVARFAPEVITVHAEMTPELKEAVDWLAPIVNASVQYFTVLHECDRDHSNFLVVDAFNELETRTSELILRRRANEARNKESA